MKALVVLNPAAGKQAHGPVCEALRLHFAASHIRYEVHETRAGEKSSELIRARLQESFDLAVAVGGDGTVSDVIDGLAGDSTPLGIVPTGTGNLIARELGIPTGIDEAVGLIAGEPCLKRIDAMRIGSRVFVLNASVGISASVIGSTTRKSKNRFGRIAYLGTTVLKLLSLKPRYLVVAVDGRAEEYRALEVAVLNCGMLAKMIYPKGPEIHIDDGRLDVWILGTKTTRTRPRNFVGMIAGRSSDLLPRFIRAESRVTIRSTIPMPVQADGDIIGTTPVEVELLPGAVTVLVPKEPVVPRALDVDREVIMAQYHPGLARSGKRASKSGVTTK